MLLPCMSAGTLTPAMSRNVSAKSRFITILSLDAAGLRLAGPADEQRRAERLFVHPPLVVPAVLAEIPALVGRVDDDGVLRQARSRRDSRARGRRFHRPHRRSAGSPSRTADSSTASARLAFELRLFELLVLLVVGLRERRLLLGRQARLRRSSLRSCGVRCLATLICCSRPPASRGRSSRRTASRARGSSRPCTCRDAAGPAASCGAAPCADT